jgi:hypothetical protein
MSLTKVSFSMIAGEMGNVLDYGAFNDGTNATATTAAFNTALSEHSSVYIPEGTYALNSTVIVPEQKQLSGSGLNTLIISTVPTSNPTFQLGKVTGALNYYPLISNMEIRLQTTSSIGILLFGTCGANVKNIRISQDNATLCTAFYVDGVYSSFFNLFENCYALHCHIGFMHSSSGSGAGAYATQQIYIGCSVFGDYSYGDTTSIGYFFTALSTGGGNGHETSIFGGNLEDCHVGVSIAGQDDPNHNAGGIHAISLFGTRFEGNEYDIDGNIYSDNCTFTGLKNLTTAKIRGFPDSGDGYGNNTFFGNGYATSSDAENFVEAASRFAAPKATATPITLFAYSGQSAPLLQVLSATATDLAKINYNGTQNITTGAIPGEIGSVTYGGGVPSTTIGSAGGASALPATPLGYITIFVGATEAKFPYYLP